MVTGSKGAIGQLGFAGLALALVAAPPALAATLIHDYQLDGTLDDTLGGASMTAIGTPVQTATGVDFFNGNGLQLAGSAFTNATAYTVLMSFRVDSANGAFGYGGIFAPRTTGGQALYVFGPGTEKVLTYYSGGNRAPVVFTYGEMHDVAFVREASGAIRIYVDGVSATAAFYPAPENSAIDPLGVAQFFSTGGENASGFVDRIRIYDGALSNAEIAAAFAPVPEPGSWAMMILGFGAVGAALRRRPARVSARHEAGAGRARPA